MNESTQTFVWRGPILVEPFWYTTSSTLEWIPSIRGPRKKPEPKRENERDGQVVLRLLLVVGVLCFLMQQEGLRLVSIDWALLGKLWRKKEPGAMPMRARI
jgi:hypothetical protein